jgi:hypothetical protein
MATLPAGIRRRYPEDEVGMTIWQHDLAAAASRCHKREQDCTTMWGLLFAAMNKTVQTKVIINSEFKNAYKKADILALWNIMHLESTNQYAGRSANLLYAQLFNLKQTGSFDQYARSFQDIVEELENTTQAPPPVLFVYRFIAGLKSDEHQEWKDKYFSDSNTYGLELPDTYLEVIADIRNQRLRQRDQDNPQQSASHAPRHRRAKPSPRLSGHRHPIDA